MQKFYDFARVPFASSELIWTFSFQCGFSTDVYFTLKKENQGLEVIKAVNHFNNSNTLTQTPLSLSTSPSRVPSLPWPWLPLLSPFHPLFILASIYIRIGIRARFWSCLNTLPMPPIHSTKIHKHKFLCLHSNLHNPNMSSTMSLEEKFEALMKSYQTVSSSN